MIQQNIYKIPRYWYHLSSTLKHKKELLHPRGNDEGFNRSEDEPNIKRICVSPTIEQCLVAIPYYNREVLSIYRTQKKVMASRPKNVFDYTITDEGWILIDTDFIRIGTLDLGKISKIKKLHPQVASIGQISVSNRLFKWWKKINISTYIDYDNRKVSENKLEKV